MQITVIPSYYHNTRELKARIKRIIMHHPLIDCSMDTVRTRLFGIPITVDVRDNASAAGIDFDWEHNSIALSFDPFIYGGTNGDKVLHHEFTHIIDRMNPDFGINCQSEDRARNIQPNQMTGSGFMAYQSVWNCYIDGRLQQFGQNPRSLKQHLQEFHDHAKHFDDHFTSEADKILECAWNSKTLTFNGIVDLVQQCLQYWKPKEIEEA